MCFIPHLATKTAPVLFQRLENPPGTALHHLQDQYSPVRDKFTLPHVAELKLREGCGCWLRYIDTEDADQQVSFLVSQPNYDTATSQPNHDSLADFLEANFRQDGFVEFFGYFYGDPGQPARAQQQLPVSAIRHPHFHFHGGTLYRFTFQ